MTLNSNEPTLVATSSSARFHDVHLGLCRWCVSRSKSESPKSLEKVDSWTFKDIEREETEMLRDVRGTNAYVNRYLAIETSAYLSRMV